MRVVAAHQVVLAPQRCAAIPFIGPSRGCRFVDTGMSLVDGHFDHVYISEPAVVEMGRLLGLPARGEFREVRDERDQLQTRVAVLEAELAEARRFREAAEYTLGQFGSKVKNKPGRKPAERTAA